MLIRYIIFTLFTAALPTLSKAAPPPSPATPPGVPPSVADIAVGYTNFHKITDRVVFVNLKLAMLCRGASQKEVEAARTRFGPHANTGILIYMNKLAADAFATNTTPFPVGAVVVKQKAISGYTDQSGKRVHDGDHGVGGMVKRPAGYDSKHGDWEYFYFEDAAKVESGRIPSCIQCHDSAKAKDYVFGTWWIPGD
jgi:hypothetical protein